MSSWANGSSTSTAESQPWDSYFFPSPQGKYPVHASIRLIAQAFAELQEKRHLAEYDRNERFKRNEVLPLIEQAKKGTAIFAALPDSDDKRFFLACLWAWKELSNR